MKDSNLATDTVAPLDRSVSPSDTTTNTRSANSSLLPELPLHLHVPKIAHRSSSSPGAHFFSRDREEDAKGEKELPA